MKVLVLDTNILLLELRIHYKWFELERQFNFDNPNIKLVISTVTVGELLSIAKRGFPFSVGQFLPQISLISADFFRF
jgi:hypothetical protein